MPRKPKDPFPPNPFPKGTPQVRRVPGGTSYSGYIVWDENDPLNHIDPKDIFGKEGQTTPQSHLTLNPSCGNVCMQHSTGGYYASCGL